MLPTTPSTGYRLYYLIGGGVALVVVMFLAIKYWPTTSSSSTQPARIMLIISGDTAGWIVPCGCTSNQSGGLLRRGTFVKQQTDGHSLILADAGGAASGTSDYHKVKFESILRGELAMGLVAHNLGKSEVELGADYLRKTADALKAPFISANLWDASGQRLFPPVRIVERAGKRIMLTGVLGKQYSGPGFTVRDPREAILEAIPQYEGKYDSLIILAYLPEEEMTQLASAIPEADAIIGGPTGQAISPKAVGQTLLGAATNKGKFLIALEAEANRKLAWTGRVVELNSTYDDDAQQQSNVKAYLNELGERDFAAKETGFVATLNLGGQAPFAGGDTCMKCHQGDCQQWEGSKHAIAWKTLVTKGYHVDAYCQQCHTTGFGQETGFISARRSQAWTAVNCESCHGPSLAHVQQVKTRTPFIAKDQCVKCHDPENSPTFQYDTYWPRILHGKPK